MQIVSEEYLMGIREGRETFKKDGGNQYAAEHLTNLQQTLKGFSAASPVGQMLRGERDFWRNQLRIKDGGLCRRC